MIGFVKRVCDFPPCPLAYCRLFLYCRTDTAHRLHYLLGEDYLAPSLIPYTIPNKARHKRLFLTAEQAAAVSKMIAIAWFNLHNCGNCGTQHFFWFVFPLCPPPLKTLFPLFHVSFTEGRDNINSIHSRKIGVFLPNNQKTQYNSLTCFFLLISSMVRAIVCIH